jgi:hypothetical protein
MHPRQLYITYTRELSLKRRHLRDRTAAIAAAAAIAASPSSVESDSSNGGGRRRGRRRESAAPGSGRPSFGAGASSRSAGGSGVRAGTAAPPGLFSPDNWGPFAPAVHLAGLLCVLLLSFAVAESAALFGGPYACPPAAGA